MGIYAKYIFPYLLDWSLNTPAIGEFRAIALRQACGHTLEIGFGTGLNLPHYPATVTELTVLDSENMLQRKVAQRVAACAIPITQMQLDAQGRLPFADQTFDTVVTTLTLCSIADTTPALAEIKRVLKQDGLFLFFEHGRSDDPHVAARQDRFNPWQNVVGVGCNMNRSIDTLIKDAGFEIADLERFLMPQAPRVLGEMYRGCARPLNTQ